MCLRSVRRLVDVQSYRQRYDIAPRRLAEATLSTDYCTHTLTTSDRTTPNIGVACAVSIADKMRVSCQMR